MQAMFLRFSNASVRDLLLGGADEAGEDVRTAAEAREPDTARGRT